MTLYVRVTGLYSTNGEAGGITYEVELRPVHPGTPLFDTWFADGPLVLTSVTADEFRGLRLGQIYSVGFTEYNKDR